MQQQNTEESRSDLHTLTILETGDSVAGAFACSLLADFGARVFVCEEPPHGSKLRSLGSSRVREVWWKVIARNKYSAAIDVHHPSSDSILREISSLANIVFLDTGRNGPSADRYLSSIEKVTRKPLVVDIHATGTDRPDLWKWSTHPALSAAATGMMALTGRRDEPPLQPEFPLAEYLSGILAASHALLAVRKSLLKSTPPERILLVLHEAVQRMIEWQVPIATSLGRPELRDGNNFPMAAGISTIHRTKDRQYVVTSAATQSVAQRLLSMVGGEELRNDPRYVTPASRQLHMTDLYSIIDKWMEARTLSEILQVANEHDVVVGPVYDAQDVLLDPHMKARENILEFEDLDNKKIRMPNILPKIQNVATKVTRLGPQVGADTDELLRLAGFSANGIEQLRLSQAIWI
jgi:crotonobetainyl-CoA:carnitine CoA-transferase CaiB-like acyl-CoA transferase